MALNYSSKHDISYANYNNKTIPWKVNTSIISQNNQMTNPSLNLGTINNNLVIESSQNDILFITSQNNNKKVIVKNNMVINNLDVSNNLTTKLIDTSSITLNNKLYFSSLAVNIIGDLKVSGAITVIGSSSIGLAKSESQFTNVTLSGSRFTDVSIVNCDISVSDFSNVNIINSYINAIPNGFGYDKSNNVAPNKAIFTDISLDRLILDSSINSYINFANNASNAISIRSSADYSKLIISKPLNVGIGIGTETGETITNISNVSIFYGTISCNTLYYSQLVPDIKLNTYFDVSIGQVSLSGNYIPASNMGFNIGSTNYKFNEIISTNFIGNLSGEASLANNLIKNLDMSFNNLNIYGTFTLNKQNLNQYLSGDLISIVAGNASFININNKLLDLSTSVYTISEFDLCLNTNIAKISLVETSFVVLNGNITSISASVYSISDSDFSLNKYITKISLRDASFGWLNNSITSISASVYSKSDFDLSLNSYIAKISLRDASFGWLNNSITSISASVYSKSDFDLCLNINVLRINDVSAIARVVSSAPNIYPTLGYNDSFSNKVTNTKVTNELAFPYAITYIDDVNEDTNIKEDYKIIETKYKKTTTITTAYTITETRVWKTTATPVSGTIGIEPDNASNNYLVMDNITSTDNNIRRKWYDSNGSEELPAVYKKIVTAASRTLISTSFELNTSALSWGDHKIQASTLSTANVEYSLAVITNEPDNTTIKNLLSSTFHIAWIGAERIKSRTWNTGGTVTEDLNYIYHTFTTVGSHTLVISNTVTVDYLIVAGGGSGGAGRGGGGGGGGVRTGTTQLSAGTHNITVGAGGVRVYADLQGNDGGSSSIGSISATGGGGGGGWSNTGGRSGGSGGGSSAGGTLAGGTGITGQGYAGSVRYNEFIGGGGGGAGAAASGKNGAIGISSAITGITKYYAGGGGGGNCLENTNAGVAYGGIYRSSYGTYGGGNGSNYNSNTANTYMWTDNAWTNDASIDLGPNSSYTVAVNLGNTSPAVTINGVVFHAHALSGNNFSIQATGGIGTGLVTTAKISGTGVALSTRGIYTLTANTPFTITLNNLTYGATYKTSFFSVGGSTAINQIFTAGAIQKTINQSKYGDSSGIIINITFIANNTGTQTISIVNVASNFGFIMYAMANRLISSSSSPSEQYTDAEANTGGGGGGTDPGFGLPSGAGGSGIVIIRYSRNMYLEGGITYWKWYNGDGWSFTKWATNEPGPNESYGVMLTDGNWYDINDNLIPAIYMKKTYSPARQADDRLVFDGTLRSLSDHITWSNNNSGNGITYKLASITNSTENNSVALFAAAANKTKIYIGGKRKASATATGTSGRSSTTWEWSDGVTAWNDNYNNFYNGYPGTASYNYVTSYTQGGRVVGAYLSGEYNENTPVNADFVSSSDIQRTNVKLPLLVSSSSGSIVATSTAISVNSLPANAQGYRYPTNDVDNIAVSGFGPTDADNTAVNGNSTIVRNYTYNTSLTASTSNEFPNQTSDVYEYKRFYKYKYDSYTYENSYYSTNNGSQSGTFKISDNSNNSSYYIKSSASDLPTTIDTSYSCIALTNDGMFVALGKASVVTVYMKTSTGWTTIGSTISINFSTYTETNVGIIPTQFTDNWRKNLQNLAINFNYFSGSTTSQLILAFGDTRNIIKVYSYSGGSWSSSNGIYSVGGGSWGNPLTSYNATTAEINNNNFGYFVTLSQSPSVLGFTVANKFYTYNCTNSNGSQRGSLQTLPNSYNGYTNIIAFKMSSDAEKIIVSNTYYVFIYKWNITDWTIITNATINLVSAAITFTYPNTITTPIPAGPRSLDISNISSDECLFAVGFPDKLIDISANRKARGYVEYWKYSNPTLTRLATLVPRKRNIDSSNVDTDEYFFSAGGIKITNANTILVAPNFKFHLNNNNKNYTLDTSNLVWTSHNTKAKLITGREMASIENEADNELVKITARNNAVWIGAMRTAIDNPTGITSAHWQWSDPSSSWNYTSFANGEPSNFYEKRIKSVSGIWYDIMDSDSIKAVYMTRLQYSLNTFTIFNNFFLHSSGFSSSYTNTAIATAVIAKWVRTDSPSTQPIEFRGNGDLKRTSQGIFTVSDIRLKENIVDSTPKLEDLLKVRVVNYNLKGSDGTKLIGVVAQELEPIFPTLVNNGELSQHDIYLGKTESYKSVKYSCFDVILIKAFQEQMAIINKLSAQLDDLESKTKSLKTISQDFVILKQELDLLKSENELFKLNINEILKLI